MPEDLKLITEEIIATFFKVFEGAKTFDKWWSGVPGKTRAKLFNQLEAKIGSRIGDYREEVFDEAYGVARDEY
jgi:hypothetical protein